MIFTKRYVHRFYFVVFGHVLIIEPSLYRHFTLIERIFYYFVAVRFYARYTHKYNPALHKPSLEGIHQHPHLSASLS